jgi:hypothetical protein
MPRVSATVPSSARSNPAMIRSIVDLPAPLTPTSATCSRSTIWKETLRKTSATPKCFVNPDTVSIVAPATRTT